VSFSCQLTPALVVAKMRPAVQAAKPRRLSVKLSACTEDGIVIGCHSPERRR